MINAPRFIELDEFSTCRFWINPDAIGGFSIRQYPCEGAGDFIAQLLVHGQSLTLANPGTGDAYWASAEEALQAIHATLERAATVRPRVPPRTPRAGDVVRILGDAWEVTETWPGYHEDLARLTRLDPPTGHNPADKPDTIVRPLPYVADQEPVRLTDTDPAT